MIQDTEKNKLSYQVARTEQTKGGSFSHNTYTVDAFLLWEAKDAKNLQRFKND